MTTDELIAALAGRAVPVRRLRAPAVRAAAWSAVALAAGAVGVVVFGARSDIGARVAHADFAWTLVVALATSIAASLAALTLAVPGAERSPALRSLAVALVATWAVGLGVPATNEGTNVLDDTHWPVCFLRVVLVGFVPAVLLVRMVRAAAPLRPVWTGLLSAGAAMAVGAMAVQIACPLDAASHALIGHFAPVVAAGGAGAIAGSRWITRHSD